MHRYQRVVVKMSGGAFAGDNDWGFDRDAIDALAGEIIALSQAGIQVAVMVGGGNIFRGRIADQWGIERVEADHIGMTATVLNSLLLRAAITAQSPDSEVRVMTAVPMAAFAEPYIRLRAIKHLEKGYIVVFAAGTGQPLVTTDYPAVQRAIEVDADAILAAKQGADGVYTADPNRDPAARRYASLSYDDVVTKQLTVMDQSAFLLARDHGIPIHVFTSNRQRAMLDICEGTPVGTAIGPDTPTVLADPAAIHAGDA
jgi:uridylate kinase